MLHNISLIVFREKRNMQYIQEVDLEDHNYEKQTRLAPK